MGRKSNRTASTKAVQEYDSDSSHTASDLNDPLGEADHEETEPTTLNHSTINQSASWMAEKIVNEVVKRTNRSYTEVVRKDDNVLDRELKDPLAEATVEQPKPTSADYKEALRQKTLQQFKDKSRMDAKMEILKQRCELHRVKIEKARDLKIENLTYRCKIQRLKIKSLNEKVRRQTKKIEDYKKIIEELKESNDQIVMSTVTLIVDERTPLKLIRDDKSLLDNSPNNAVFMLVG